MRYPMNTAIAAFLALSLQLPPCLAASLPVGRDASASYTLGAGDKLRITVFNEPNLTGDYTVTSDGNVSLPLIGNVSASGMTLIGLQASLVSQLAPFIKDPRVSVEQTIYRPYYILGEVNKPGEYVYSDGLQVSQAVATAGGYTYRANRGTVSVTRADNAKEERFKLHNQKVPVKPGDTIRVGERFF